jgi:hypothetical protein
MQRLSGSGGNVAQRPRIALYAAAMLSWAAALIHLLAMPKHFEEWWGYGTFFLVTAAFQALYGLFLLRRPGVSVLLLGIVANAAIVVLWLVTRTASIPFFGPHAGEVEAVGVLDLAATAAELSLIIVLAGLWWSTQRPDAVPLAGELGSSAEGGLPSAWHREQLLVLLGVCVIVAAGVALIMLLVTRPPATARQRRDLPGTCPSTTPRPWRWRRSCATGQRARRSASWRLTSPSPSRPR